MEGYLELSIPGYDKYKLREAKGLSLVNLLHTLIMYFFSYQNETVSWLQKHKNNIKPEYENISAITINVLGYKPLHGYTSGKIIRACMEKTGEVEKALLDMVIIDYVQLFSDLNKIMSLMTKE